MAAPTIGGGATTHSKSAHVATTFARLPHNCHRDCCSVVHVQQAERNDVETIMKKTACTSRRSRQNKSTKTTKIDYYLLSVLKFFPVDLLHRTTRQWTRSTSTRTCICMTAEKPIVAVSTIAGTAFKHHNKQPIAPPVPSGFPFTTQRQLIRQQFERSTGHPKKYRSISYSFSST